MKTLKTFIDQNYISLSNMGYSEVEQYKTNTFDDDTIQYLKQNYRFDYRGICVYYVEDMNEVWVETMDDLN